MRKMKMVLLGLCILLSGIFENVKAGQSNNESNTTNKESTQTILEQKIKTTYSKLDFGIEQPLAYKVFKEGFIGFLNLKESGKLNSSKHILSIADYSLSANKKRLWVIDLDHNKILFHTLVAHGQGTGEEFAENFSNNENSHQSSIGFFITQDTYMGDNGYSLKLQGLDANFNNNAYDRAIVIHGADYVSDAFIRNNQRLGRSWGCPAVPRNLATPIIDKIKGETCFFAYFPNQKYLASSKWLNKVPSLSDQDRIDNQFISKPNQKALLAEADIQKPSSKEENDANKAAITPKSQKPSYNGTMLNVPDAL